VNVEKYTGRIVRLNQRVFEEIKHRTKNQGEAVENFFLVSEVRRGLKQLICYGANLRIVVSVADVTLI
jgi:hypothetical protein